MHKSDLSFENSAGKAQVIWVGMLFPMKRANRMCLEYTVF